MALLLTDSVDDTAALVSSLLDSLDVSSLVESHFPTPELVSAAAGLLTPLPRWDGREGARRRLVIAPGLLRVSSTDPARGERAAERAIARHRAKIAVQVVEDTLEGRVLDAESAEAACVALVAAGVVEWSAVQKASDHVEFLTGWQAAAEARAVAGVRGTVTCWSKRSRARMVARLSELDYSVMLGGVERAAMVTLTYPGDWLTVAPDAAACVRHLRVFGRRFQRAWGRPLVAVWKREFQRRGAPHYHLLMVPPHGTVTGPDGPEGFVAWLSRTWADVVGHPDPVERAAHRRAGTGVDYAEGMRQSDPRRVAVYFSKHGAYGAKEYQNHAPEEWTADGGSVGRFWGYWGLQRATRAVEVSHVEAYAAARTLRRWSRANGYVAKVDVWRADVRTGVVRRRKAARRSGRMPGHLGFVTVNDGPALASTLVRHLDAVRERAQRAELVGLGWEPWHAGE